MDYKIVADSSADLISLKDVPFCSAPLKIITDQNEYVDDSNLDVVKMINDLKCYSGKSSTSCPSVSDWLDTFGYAKYIFCVTITSNLSGSYNSAVIAKQEYETTHPESKVFVIDSLSAGPELKLIVEKLEELILFGKEYEEICKDITEYQKHTKLLFMLESLTNLANNGRVSKATAKIAGILGIRVVGKASDQGTLETLEKARGEKKGLNSILQNLKNLGYKGGKIRISHCLNKPLAELLSTVLKTEFGTKDIEIYPTAALCSFYAEKGGLLIGFEI